MIIVPEQRTVQKSQRKDESAVVEPIGVLLMVGLVALAGLIVGVVWFGAFEGMLTEPALFTGTATAYNIEGKDSVQGIKIISKGGDVLSFQDKAGGKPAYITLIRPDGNRAVLTYGTGTDKFSPGDTLYISTLSRNNATYQLTKEQPASKGALENGTWRVIITDGTLDVPLLSVSVLITGDVVEGNPGFSVESWVKWNKIPAPESNNEKWATIVVKGDSDANRAYHLQHNMDNSRFEFAAATSNKGSNVQSSTSPQKDIWYHVVGIYDQNEGKIAIYVNGTMEKSNTNMEKDGLRSSVGSYQVGKPDGIFYNNNIGTRRFDGTISGLEIYGRRLTDAEIVAHATAGHP
ncbi:MAG: LamG domain-containing protein [Methanomicrobiales archaeon]|jgi:hypothetical protein|nr:LamG domain-containing protein [Methanomicrobiales archaeon]